MPQLVWLVTGCSSGFGEQFVHSIVARGDKVIATARKTSTFKALEEAGVATLQLDITDSQEAIQHTVDEAISIHGRIDVLVNNAGFVTIGTWEDLDSQDFVKSFDTNVFGTIKVTRAVLPHFRQRRAGTAVFISSLSGWVGHPGVGAYAGSKFALEGVVEALWKETKDLGIKTLMIEPGRFRTMLLSGRNVKAKQSSISEYSEFSKNLLTGIAGEDRAQPGDPAKLVEITLDLVRQEGIAKDKEVPFRLPLGIDCYDEMKAKLEETLKLLEDWKEVIRGTDHADQAA